MKSVEKMNQSELVDFANELHPGSRVLTFEESIEYFQKKGDKKKTGMFKKILERWTELEKPIKVEYN